MNARSESERGSGAQRTATEVCHHPRSGESLFHVTDQQACTCQCVLPRPPEQPLGGRERPRDPFRASCPLPRGSRGHPGPGAPLRARQGTPSPTCVSRCVAPGRTPRGFAAAPLGVSVEGVASLPRGAEPEGCTPPPPLQTRDSRGPRSGPGWLCREGPSDAQSVRLVALPRGPRSRGSHRVRGHLCRLCSPQAPPTSGGHALPFLLHLFGLMVSTSSWGTDSFGEINPPHHWYLNI